MVIAVHRLNLGAKKLTPCLNHYRKKTTVFLPIIWNCFGSPKIQQPSILWPKKLDASPPKLVLQNPTLKGRLPHVTREPRSIVKTEQWDFPETMGFSKQNLLKPWGFNKKPWDFWWFLANKNCFFLSPFSKTERKASLPPVLSVPIHALPGRAVCFWFFSQTSMFCFTWKKN